MVKPGVFLTYLFIAMSLIKLFCFMFIHSMCLWRPSWMELKVYDTAVGAILMQPNSRFRDKVYQGEPEFGFNAAANKGIGNSLLGEHMHPNYCFRDKVSPGALMHLILVLGTKFQLGARMLNISYFCAAIYIVALMLVALNLTLVDEDDFSSDNQNLLHRAWWIQCNMIRAKSFVQQRLSFNGVLGFKEEWECGANIHMYLFGFIVLEVVKQSHSLRAPSQIQL
ncbi:hypothetical protein Prudu_003359 [Prunus dulcis]|uniref:Uncharacterized protein n=1 Tax=Prunus dulcis TaxID=3755 RepID=A0A4Y1QSV3_PRUDU|nr:hypothetical protein Prudu_003359 [Prunus dulcis]